MIFAVTVLKYELNPKKARGFLDASMAGCMGLSKKRALVDGKGSASRELWSYSLFLSVGCLFQKELA